MRLMKPAAKPPTAPKKASFLRVMAAYLVVPLLFPALLTVTRAGVQQDFSAVGDDMWQTYKTYFQNFDGSPNLLMIGLIYLWTATLIIGTWRIGRGETRATFFNRVPIFILVSEVLLLGFMVVFFTRMQVLGHVGSWQGFSLRDMVIEPHLYDFLISAQGYVIFWILSGLPWFRGTGLSSKANRRSKRDLHLSA